MVMGPTKEDSPKVSCQVLMEDGKTHDDDEKYATLDSHWIYTTAVMHGMY